jgi:methylmalonyl-CoA/ethylmalonyl-CoA epimerase
VSARRFAKINVRVKNLDAAFAYARDVLEAEVLREQSNTAFGDMFMVRVGGLIIEVLAPDRPDSSLAQIIERRGEGIDSIGFYVDDIKAATEAMEASGIRFASKDERLAWVHPKNPLSLSIELLNSALVQLDPEADR